MLLNPDPAFWYSKRVLLTGHTGFKGSWLALWLHRLGAKVTGIALAPDTAPNLFALAGVANYLQSHIQDIRDPHALAAIVRGVKPDIILHLAAQPLVRASYLDPLGTLATNVQGTANLLDALRGCDSVRVAVMVTTDKVYRNLEQPFPYRESDVLGGHDPYSASKAAAELIITSYRDAYLRDQGVAVASARAGNVIGGGDWAEDRLIPDAVRAWSRQQPLHVRSPEAIRPWQHVLEPLAGYLLLAERLWSAPELAEAYNFGPPTHEAASVRTVITQARSVFGDGEILWNTDSEGPHEAGCLLLEIAKARSLLGVVPRWTLNQAVERSLNWYRRQMDGADAAELCAQDIAAFEATGRELVGFPQDEDDEQIDWEDVFGVHL